jgi:hypothetical protein
LAVALARCPVVGPGRTCARATDVDRPASTASGAQTALQRAPGPDLARYPTWDSVVALVEDTRDIKLLSR